MRSPPHTRQPRSPHGAARGLRGAKVAPGKRVARPRLPLERTTLFDALPVVAQHRLGRYVGEALEARLALDGDPAALLGDLLRNVGVDLQAGYQMPLTSGSELYSIFFSCKAVSSRLPRPPVLLWNALRIALFVNQPSKVL